MNIALIILTALWLLAYLTFCSYIFIGWRKLSFFTYRKEEPSVKISIIAAFRNEMRNLPSFLEGIIQQDYPNSLFELIMIDDHSEDGGKEYLLSRQKDCGFKLTVLKLNENESFKKTALSKGIANAHGELIVCTDVDTDRSAHWLSYLSSYYESNDPDMILSTVLMHETNTFLRDFQKMDFLALQLVTGAFAGNNNSILANGANLAFKKSAFDEVGGYDNTPSTVSGDDFFLMLMFKKRGKRISFLPWKNTIVFSPALTSFSDFINQRVRWAAKSKYARDASLYAAGIYNTVINILLILIPILDIANHTFPQYSMVIVLSKYLGDYIMLRTTARIYQVSFNPVDFLLSFIFYPFYISYIFTLSLFKRPVWKGRKI